MILVFIWIQWSWKWTQGRILQEKFGFKIYETWNALREIRAKDTPLWQLVKSTIESWNQVTPEIVEDILKEVIENNENKKIILDWFVRNKWNKISVDKIVWDYRVIYFNLSEEIARERLLGRMYDTQTWETFPANILINPKNWNTLVKRADDEEKTIDQRIKLFFELTMPIIEEYKNEWKLIEIDANWNIDEISSRIQEKLWL